MSRNILLVCSDQHAPEITGCYGNELVETPNIDRLAREGTTFDAAYCSQPICVPSRMSFMTGRHPHQAGVLENRDILDSRIPTFAHVASGAGYRTALAGRMHFMGPDQFHGFQEHVGSDYTAYAFHAGKINRYRPLPGLLGNAGRPDPLRTVGAGKTCTQSLDRENTTAALDWLEAYADSAEQRPFLLTVGYFSPHCPYIVEKPYFEKYIDRVEPIVPSADELAALHPYHHSYRKRIELDTIPRENLAKATAAYYGLVDFLDDQIGLLMKGLVDLGLAADTEIIYFSDHGEMLGRHGRWHKMCFFEASARVPLIVRADGAERGGRVDSPVSLVDIFPTVCRLTGRNVGLDLPGRSLLDEADPQRPVFSEYHDGDGSHRMVRRGQYKLSVYAGSDRAELFDLAADPDEQVNRAGDPELDAIEAELRKLIYQDGWSGDLIHQHKERLTALGFDEVVSGMKQAEPLITDGTIPEIPGYDHAVSHYENSVEE